ncbi:hypothetical protein C8R43DRAFT_964678 [Mycena crocata]|nr:hypothetical protein C8R43DRAFT_964678 [Mycena crocata]
MSFLAGNCLCHSHALEGIVTGLQWTTTRTLAIVVKPLLCIIGALGISLQIVVDDDLATESAEMVNSHHMRWEYLQLFAKAAPSFGDTPLLHSIDIRCYPDAIMLPWSQLTHIRRDYIFSHESTAVLQQTTRLDHNPQPDGHLPVLKSLVSLQEESEVVQGYIESCIAQVYTHRAAHHREIIGNEEVVSSIPTLTVECESAEDGGRIEWGGGGGVYYTRVVLNMNNEFTEDKQKFQGGDSTRRCRYCELAGSRHRGWTPVKSSWHLTSKQKCQSMGGVDITAEEEGGMFNFGGRSTATQQGHIFPTATLDDCRPGLADIVVAQTTGGRSVARNGNVSRGTAYGCVVQSPVMFAGS